MLLHTENSLLSLLEGEAGVVQKHTSFVDTALQVRVFILWYISIIVKRQGPHVPSQQDETTVQRISFLWNARVLVQRKWDSCWLINELLGWFENCLVDWWIAWLIDGLLGWLMNCLVNLRIAWLIDGMLDWLIYFLDDLRIAWLIDGLLDWLVDCKIDLWMDWLIDGLLGWLTFLLAVQLRHHT